MILQIQLHLILIVLVASKPISNVFQYGNLGYSGSEQIRDSSNNGIGLNDNANGVYGRMGNNLLRFSNNYANGISEKAYHNNIQNNVNELGLNSQNDNNRLISSYGSGIDTMGGYGSETPQMRTLEQMSMSPTNTINENNYNQQRFNFESGYQNYVPRLTSNYKDGTLEFKNTYQAGIPNNIGYNLDATRLEQGYGTNVPRTDDQYRSGISQIRNNYENDYHQHIQPNYGVEIQRANNLYQNNNDQVDGLYGNVRSNSPYQSKMNLIDTNRFITPNYQDNSLINNVRAESNNYGYPDLNQNLNNKFGLRLSLSNNFRSLQNPYLNDVKSISSSYGSNDLQNNLNEFNDIPSSERNDNVNNVYTYPKSINLRKSYASPPSRNNMYNSNSYNDNMRSGDSNTLTNHEIDSVESSNTVKSGLTSKTNNRILSNSYQTNLADISSSSLQDANQRLNGKYNSNGLDTLKPATDSNTFHNNLQRMYNSNGLETKNTLPNNGQNNDYNTNKIDFGLENPAKTNYNIYNSNGLELPRSAVNNNAFDYNAEASKSSINNFPNNMYNSNSADLSKSNQNQIYSNGVENLNSAMQDKNPNNIYNSNNMRLSNLYPLDNGYNNDMKAYNPDRIGLTVMNFDKSLDNSALQSQNSQNFGFYQPSDQNSNINKFDTVGNYGLNTENEKDNIALGISPQSPLQSNSDSSSSIQIG